MLKDLLKEGGLYTFANLLTSGISLLLIPFYTAYFTPSEYGIIDIIVVFGAFFNAIVSLQLGQGLARFVGDGSSDDASKLKHGSTAILSTVVIYIVSSFIVFLSRDFFIDVLSADVEVPGKIFSMAILSIAINGIFYTQGVYFRFLRKTKIFTLLSFIHAIGNIILTLIFVLVLDMGIEGIFVAAVIVAPIIVLIQTYLLRNHLKIYFGFAEFKDLLKFSVPLIPAGISYALLNFTDRIFINTYLDSAQLGIYGIGVKFSSVVILIITGFSMAITPLIYEKHHLQNTKEELTRIAKLFFSIGTLGVLIISLFSLETLYVFTNSDYYEAATVMPILYTSVLFTGVWMFSPGLNIEKKTSVTAIVVVISGLLNILLNYLLMPHFDLIGAALATLISVIFNNLVLFYLANKYFKINLPFVKILINFLIFSILICFSQYILPYLHFDMRLNILIKLGLIILYVTLIIRTRLFDLSYIYKLKTWFKNAQSK